MDPYIVVYHDAMFDSEIEIIKKMARPRFRRATVQNAITGELETANYRISKSAWLKTEEHHIIQNIVQRTEDMTGLDMATAEELQVVNYGIGGHYEPHFDFARVSSMHHILILMEKTIHYFKTSKDGLKSYGVYCIIPCTTYV